MDICGKKADRLSGEKENFSGLSIGECPRRKISLLRKELRSPTEGFYCRENCRENCRGKLPGKIAGKNCREKIGGIVAVRIQRIRVKIFRLSRGLGKIADESAEEICVIISLQIGSSRNDYGLPRIFWDFA
ncbi:MULTISPECIES: hypothetical protein [Planktothricoides]|uniref:Uncharacterized protein n=2 Tax=Planktothricoides raciborskii TaxID=132608 RepID=A0AAU8J8S1_9CYAN|nr:MULTISPECIES: hypothetical protein [Planktothricoides]MBD2543252.1 hypothetical protein [Planktothricoides raciborskii FACHB-1370]MBD2580833.1 hypothetical protein [Planktothricoides raciborskii FACHB-1261]